MFDSIDLESSLWESAARLVMAMCCGALIGWDRQSQGRDAGLRTHIMVALGSAGFTLIAMEMIEALSRGAAQPSGEPLRIIAAIIGGIGFLGAGAIIQSGGKVRGLTTAAGLWVIAAVGIAAGAGYYANAVMTTVLAFITLTVLRRVERRMPLPDENADLADSEQAER